MQQIIHISITVQKMQKCQRPSTSYSTTISVKLMIRNGLQSWKCELTGMSTST